MTRLKILAKSKESFLCLSAILLLLLLFFFKLLIRGEVLEGFGDILPHFLPSQFFYAQALKGGRLPLWSPYAGSGFPIFAEGQPGFFYPLKFLLYSLLPFPLAFNLQVVSPVFMASVFMYLYARSLRLLNLPALLSAIVFAFSGFLIVHLSHLSVAMAFSFLPLGFFLIENFIAKKNPLYLLLISPTIALQILSGDFPMAMRSLLAFTLYFFFRASPHFRNKQILFRKVSLWLVAVVLGLGLATIQIVPSLELTRLSVRGADLGLEFRNSYFYPLSSLITFIFPNLYGREYNADPRIGTYWGPWSYLEMTAYVGILPLFLALIAFRKRKEAPYISFFLFLLIFSLILAMGASGGLYFILQLIPPFDRFRGPARFLGLVVFSLAVFSGFGFQKLLTGKKGESFILINRGLKDFGWLFLIIFLISIFFFPTISFYVPSAAEKAPQITASSIVVPLFLIAGAVFLMSLFSLGKIKRNGFSLLVILFVTQDLFLFGINYNRTVEKYVLPETVKFLRQDKTRYRILPFPLKKHFTLDKLPTLSDLAGNSSALFGIESADIYSQLSLLRYEELLSKIVDENNTDLLENRILDILNVKYVLADKPLEQKRLKLAHDKEILIYKNRDVLPRAFVVNDFEVKKGEEVLGILASSDFDPKEEVLLESEPPVDLNKPGELNSEVKITNYQNERVAVEVSLKKSGILVLSDIFYPGWKAYVNGKEERLFRANYVFRAVPLKEGRSLVEFVYEPDSLKLGIIVSLISLFLWGTLVLAFMIIKR